MQQLNSSVSNTSFWTSGTLTQRVAPSVVLGFCFLVGVPGNIMVIMKVLHYFKRENFTVKLMLNLAVSDILCLITLPLWIYGLLCGWVFGNAGCKLISYMVYCSLYVSLLTVTLMSVQRYIQVLYSQYWVRLHGTGEKVLLSVLWVISCVLACPALKVRRLMEIDTNLKCDWDYSSDGENMAITTAETLLGFVFPFSIITTSYCCLHKKVNQTAFFSSQRMTKLVVSIVVTFCIFWIPVHVDNVLIISYILLKSSHPDVSSKLQNFCSLSEDIVGSLIFINSCVNPFLYAFASRNLRQDPERSTKTQEVSTSNL